MAEIVSPAPDAWDPSWPEDKAFGGVLLPSGSSIGETSVAGYGGGESRFQVEEKAGRFCAVLVERWYVLADEQKRSRWEAHLVFGE